MKNDNFDIPAGQIYLAGHSLGPLPKITRARLAQTIEQDWGGHGVRAWDGADWMGLAERVGAALAPCIGVAAAEIAVADNVSVNVFKLIAAACAAQPKRTQILVEADDFPTDAYVAAGAAALLGKEIAYAPRQGLAAALTRETAAVITSHTHYRSAHVQNMAALNAQAALVGAPVIWDISHSCGAVALNLRDEGAHLAVGCGYKYLSGGPGAPAFVYVSQEMQRLLKNPIYGWAGCADPMAFAPRYAPKRSAGAFATGTAPILSLIGLEAGVEIFAAANPDALQNDVRTNSQAFISALAGKEAAHGLTRASPHAAEERGGHVAYRHPHAYAIVQALADKGVIADYRPPDLMRFAFAPLYITLAEARQAGALLIALLDSGAYRDPKYRPIKAAP